MVGSRKLGLRPPSINCWVWQKNSTSRMPPRPILILCPSNEIFANPLWVWICDLIAWISSMAAKSIDLRQIKGIRKVVNSSPAVISPAMGRALIMAARSQF